MEQGPSWIIDFRWINGHGDMDLPSERDALQAIAETIVGAFKQSL
jgi:hypothetical protein